MNARSPQRPKRTPTPKAPQNQPPAESNDMQISFEEMQAGYEAQIGAMSTMIVQQNIMLEKLKRELTKKRTRSDDGPSPEGPADS